MGLERGSKICDYVANMRSVLVYGEVYYTLHRGIFQSVECDAESSGILSA